MSVQYKLLIDGELLDGDRVLDVIDPATGDVFTSVACASPAQLELAVQAAKRAFPAWSKTPLDERRRLVIELADRLQANADKFARMLTLEQGKPLSESMFEINTTVHFMRQIATMDLSPKLILEDEAYRIEGHKAPLGVVAGIAPWNFPVLLSAMKLAPAVLTGNTFLIKPAPTTPITALMLGEIAKDVFPAGVVNTIVDNNDLGTLISGHPDIAKISFTGSTTTGKKVLETAAPTLKRLTLELGGNDAGIVLDDVDVEVVANKIFDAAFYNAGQVCIAMKRVYAHSSIYDRLCEALATRAKAAIVGDGLQQGTQIGPLQNKAQFEKAKSFLDAARAEGTIIAGGNVIDTKGYFVQPTIVRDIQDGTKLVDEEQFAPILPVLKYDDIDDALARANSTKFGLGGSVWGSDTNRAYEVAQHVESGTVWVNHHMHFAAEVPFGGAKESGIGADYGEEGLAAFTQLKVVNIAK